MQARPFRKAEGFFYSGKRYRSPNFPQSLLITIEASNQQPVTSYMKQQLIDAWRISNKMNLLLIDNISDEGMHQTLSTHGGRKIYEQLVHVHNVRLGWLENAAKEIFVRYKFIDKQKPFDREVLRRSFEESAVAIEELIEQSWEHGGKVKGFKTGLIPFISYLMAHDAHHRGHALLTLKESGLKIPETLKWGLWEWEK